MRLVYLSDTHIQGGRPEYRQDNFLKAIYIKLSEVVNLCRQLNVDFVIHGGDVFDNPRPDQRSFDLFRWFLKELGVPVYCIAGNHDLVEQRLDSLETTAIAYLDRQHLITLLKPGEKLYLSNNSCVLQLSGQHFYAGIDRRKNKDDYVVTKKRCDIAIHVVHGMLLPKQFSDKVPCTLISEVAGTEADYTLGAHAHLGYHEYSGVKYFLNPGALARLTNLKQELVRIPRIIFMDFTGPASYKYITLENVRPGGEVMNIKKKSGI